MPTPRYPTAWVPYSWIPHPQEITPPGYPPHQKEPYPQIPYPLDAHTQIPYRLGTLPLDTSSPGHYTSWIPSPPEGTLTRDTLLPGSPPGYLTSPEGTWDQRYPTTLRRNMTPEIPYPPSPPPVNRLTDTCENMTGQ